MDYDALIFFIRGVPTHRLIITPHIFHELYKHAQKDFDDNLKQFFCQCFDKLIQMEEKYSRKEEILKDELFIELEIGEHSLVCLCNKGNCYALLHDDRKICGKLRKNEEILTISLKEDVVPLYLTNL